MTSLPHKLKKEEVVILDIKNYIGKANRRLNESNNYDNETSTQQSYILNQ